MNERKHEITFIPCGDALEKMDAIGGAAPEDEPCAAEKQEENPEVND